jgi:hypothetical protein
MNKNQKETNSAVVCMQGHQISQNTREENRICKVAEPKHHMARRQFYGSIKWRQFYNTEYYYTTLSNESNMVFWYRRWTTTELSNRPNVKSCCLSYFLLQHTVSTQTHAISSNAV